MKQVLYFLIIATILTSCSSVDETESLDFAQRSVEEKNKWWLAFSDELMSEFADEIIKSNIDIKLAAAKLQELQGFEKITFSSLLPEISGEGSLTKGNNKSSKATIQRELGLKSTWDVDIFGRNRAAYNAAGARVESAQANVDDIRNLIIAKLCSTVVSWRQAKQTIYETRKLLSTQDSQITLIKAKVDAGLIDSSFLARAMAQRFQTSILLSQAEASANSAQHMLETLLSIKDNSLRVRLENDEQTGIKVPDIAPILSVNVDTIKNRPDVRAARLNLVAADNDLSQAEAALWPSINLSGFYGVQNGYSAIPMLSNPIWYIVPSFAQPLFNFGKLSGGIDVANARARQSSLVYENTVLTALEETKIALSDFLSGINTLTQQLSSWKHRREAVKISGARFQRGLTDMIELTTEQADFHQATILLIEGKAAANQAYIKLQKSLGF